MPLARAWVAPDLAPSARAAPGTAAAATTAAEAPKRVLIACDRDMGSLDIAKEVEEELQSGGTGVGGRVESEGWCWNQDGVEKVVVGQASEHDHVWRIWWTCVSLSRRGGKKAHLQDMCEQEGGEREGVH